MDCDGYSPETWDFDYSDRGADGVVGDGALPATVSAVVAVVAAVTDDALCDAACCGCGFGVDCYCRSASLRFLRLAQ